MRKKIERIRRKRNAEDIGICFEPLEPRLLLSGSWAAGAESASLDPQPTVQGDFTQETASLFENAGITGMHALQQDQSQPQTGRIVDILAQASAIEEVASVEPDPETASSADQTAPAGSDARTTSPEDADSSASNSAPQPDSTAASAERELVFVNGNVADYEQLIADLQGSDDNRAIEVVVLDSDRNGIEQVSEILSDRAGLSAVHFITHGADGMISLGSSWLTDTNLPQHSEVIVKWGEALTETGDILFYGCNIAAGSDGQSLVDGIAELTGADVAASSDPTGTAALGGDWVLEYAAGLIQTPVALSEVGEEDWAGVLANPTLAWNTFQGGGAGDASRAVVVDASGNQFVGGYLGTDAAVWKLDSSGNLLWTKTLGGTGTDQIDGITLDAGGNIYVTGYSTATWGSPVRAMAAARTPSSPS